MMIIISLVVHVPFPRPFASLSQRFSPYCEKHCESEAKGLGNRPHGHTYYLCGLGYRSLHTYHVTGGPSTSVALLSVQRAEGEIPDSAVCPPHYRQRHTATPQHRLHTYMCMLMALNPQSPSLPLLPPFLFPSLPSLLYMYLPPSLHHSLSPSLPLPLHSSLPPPTQ